MNWGNLALGLLLIGVATAMSVFSDFLLLPLAVPIYAYAVTLLGVKLGE